MAALVAAAQDPEILRFMDMPAPYTDEDARAYLEIGPSASSGWRGCSSTPSRRISPRSASPRRPASPARAPSGRTGRSAE